MGRHDCVKIMMELFFISFWLKLKMEDIESFLSAGGQGQPRRDILSRWARPNNRAAELRLTTERPVGSFLGRGRPTDTRFPDIHFRVSFCVLQSHYVIIKPWVMSVGHAQLVLSIFHGIKGADWNTVACWQNKTEAAWKSPGLHSTGAGGLCDHLEYWEWSRFFHRGVRC